MTATRTSTKDLVTIGQTWQCKRDKTQWVVRQVWRAGAGQVRMLRRVTGEQKTIRLSELRAKWRLLDET